MARPPRRTVEGMAYHVLNRRVMRLPLFQKPADYQAFQRILAAGQSRPDAPQLLGWCLMPNHWHLVLLAGPDSDLSSWMQWLTVTHTHRWHQHYHSVGEGPLYQGRFKSFPVQQDGHLLRVLRYVEANALRAKLVDRAEHWPWGSLWWRGRAEPGAQNPGPLEHPRLGQSPVALPADWVALVNQGQEQRELEQVRHSVRRGAPLGLEGWVRVVVQTLDLQATQRPRGRPRKSRDAAAAIL